MSYVKPSPQVYEDLVNSGGVLNSTPDLDVCIIGPLYNSLQYIPGSLPAQLNTAVTKFTNNEVATIASGSFVMTVVSGADFYVGQNVIVVGAGVSGANLQANVVSVSGLNVTLDTAASTSVVAAPVAGTGIITNSAINNTFVLAGQQPGQIVTPSSVAIWLSNSLVKTLVANVTSTAGTNVLTVTGLTTTGNITTATAALTVVSSAGFSVGAAISVAGAGASGATLTTTVSSIAGNVITLATNASTTVTNAVVTGTAASNLNTITSTLRAEPGDSVVISYTATSVARTFTTTIQSILTSNGNTGNITSITLNDILPSNFANPGVVTVQKAYNDLALPLVKPISGGNNYDLSTVGTAGTITIESGVEVVYGPIISASVFAGYSALRTDLSGQVITIANEQDLIGTLGPVIDDTNPLGLACSIAFANTTTRVKAIAVSTNDSIGYQTALDVAQGDRVYYLVPLTQDPSIIELFEAHVAQLSTPQNASWRVVLANTAIPLVNTVGPANVNSPATGAAITLVNSNYILTDATATFITNGVVPGDILNITAASAGGLVGSHVVNAVLSNQQVQITATTTGTAVSYYVTRNLSKSQQAAIVAATSTNFGLNRVWHVQPDIVGVTVNGVVKYLPGYYLAAGLGGMGAGFPVQQGFTNVGVAGIADLKHSNFYFTKSQLDTMAAAGTCLFVQDVQQGIPYCRHELTTDISVLEYREMLLVKNWDFIAYFYYDKIKPFIGTWNITSDTLNTIRQTLDASTALLISQKLPKIGPPLLSAKIISLAQDANNKDTVDCYLQIALVYPLNYLDLHLVI